MLTHIMNGHTGYQGPVCFDWEPDQRPCPAVNASTVAVRADEYVSLVLALATTESGDPVYRHPLMLVPFGNDFRFRHAENQFSNMDRIVAFINANPGRYMKRSNLKVSMRYATATEYLEALKGYAPELPSMIWSCCASVVHASSCCVKPPSISSI